MAIHDITPLVTERLAVWPGDTPARREVLLDQRRGDAVTLSTLHATVHLGAHADAPSHYAVDGATMEAMPLDVYVGPAQVIRVAAERGKRVARSAVDGVELRAPRVLLATGTYPDPTAFRHDFAGLEPALVERLHAAGVVLVGVDTPSVDLFESKDLAAHRACLRAGIAILEGLVLQDVPDGTYELIALPLRLSGFDGSPVRAVLRTLDGTR
jgi:arylformamidase